MREPQFALICRDVNSPGGKDSCEVSQGKFERQRNDALRSGNSGNPTCPR